MVFRTDGWYEVLLEVNWNPSVRGGTRFSHTNIPGQEPLHSEAIAADVLADIRGGKQLLRSNSVFGPNRTTPPQCVKADASSPSKRRESAVSQREVIRGN